MTLPRKEIKWFIGLFIGFFCVATVSFLLCARWCESPSGTRQISEWLTKIVAQRVPHTAVLLTGLHFNGLSSVDIREVIWEEQNHQPLLIADHIRIRAKLSEWHTRWPRWFLSADVKWLDVEALDMLFQHGKWKAMGIFSGAARLEGRGRYVDQATFHLEALSPGGVVSAEVIDRLVHMLPQEDVRAQLLKALKGKILFHFQIGKISMETEGENYLFKFLLDGDHLLDVAIRVPKKEVSLLQQLF